MHVSTPCLPACLPLGLARAAPQDPGLGPHGTPARALPLAVVITTAVHWNIGTSERTNEKAHEQRTSNCSNDRQACNRILIRCISSGVYGRAGQIPIYIEDAYGVPPPPPTFGVWPSRQSCRTERIRQFLKLRQTRRVCG